ncbi:hypothetical protein NQ317_002763 [Molorchus minor]|uniref:t-SNARE coiled-coil homology domain-containing protein n=1 Tax=Molorchus minor TaxID=1323400 RepID=A0ABQ9J5W0_9CUCU|nr:hypothetical protein NQ317_002763 [Molorchus minor]
MPGLNWSLLSKKINNKENTGSYLAKVGSKPTNGKQFFIKNCPVSRSDSTLNCRSPSPLLTQVSASGSYTSNVEGELEKAVEKVTNRNDDTDKENCNPFEGTSQIQIQDDLKSIKLKQQQEQLNQVENINKDVGELHEMYKHLNQMVDCQSENVDHIEKTVDDSQKNVDAGAKDIMKVHKLKAVAYPVTGAFLGGMIGGPIGLVAGLKIGGVAALGCAIAGYTGGFSEQ